MNEKTKEHLVLLADKYETISFCDDDPSQFLRHYKKSADTELISFIAAMLSFGSRKQFIPKINFITELADSRGGIFLWIKNDFFKNDFRCGSEKFYRFYSFDDMQILFSELSQILKSEKTLGEYFKIKHEESPLIPLCDLISLEFQKSKIVPKGKTSAKKRINMFLRWMVRKNSSVDLGLWQWYNQKNLLIPLDVHVMEEAVKLNLIDADSKPNRKTAEKLTNAMNEIFPDDPVRADFALFGLGVDKK